MVNLKNHWVKAQPSYDIAKDVTHPYQIPFILSFYSSERFEIKHNFWLVNHKNNFIRQYNRYYYLI